MDSRDKGFVKCLDAIGREEENALEVLKQTKEDADQGVAVYVVDGALFEEDVGFVEEQ